MSVLPKVAREEGGECCLEGLAALGEKAGNTFAPKAKWKAQLQQWMPASSQASLCFGGASEIVQLLVDSQYQIAVSAGESNLDALAAGCSDERHASPMGF